VGRADAAGWRGGTCRSLHLEGARKDLAHDRVLAVHHSHVLIHLGKGAHNLGWGWGWGGDGWVCVCCFGSGV
jgi:hypothetical protein